jgi:diguanylate cyclase (GGDEF)-like protein
VAKSSRLTVTAEIVSAITSSLVLDEVLASIAQRTCEVLELWECDIYGWVAPQEEAACLAVWALEPEPGDDDWVGGRLRLTEHPTFRRVLHEGRLLAAYLADPGLPAADRARMEAWGERSCLLVPLIFKGEVIGCLQLIEKRHTRLFSERDRQLATTLAALAAVAIQNARLYGELEALAITDGVTALFNHRHFHERLAAEVARANRYGLALSLLLIDIDGFKDYNDRCGHPAGDTLLRALGALLIEQTRTQIDIVARYGGDEFAVILPSTGGEGAGFAGERLRDAIEQQRLDDVGEHAARDAGGSPRDHDGDVALAAAERIRHGIEGEHFGSRESLPVVTVSIGVASLVGADDSLESLIEAADRALYRAKQAGRNRVALADRRGAVT